MTQPERSEDHETFPLLVRELQAVARCLPKGWTVEVDGSGQLRLLPPAAARPRLTPVEAPSA